MTMVRERPWRPSAIQIALIASLAVHGGLLFVRFVNPLAFDRIFQDTPLEVVLVNSRSNEPVVTPQAIAQATLSGGGDADKGRALSPLAPSPETTMGDTSEDARKQIEKLQEAQQRLLTQLRREVAAIPPPDPRRDEGAPEEQAQEEKRRQMLQLLAEIEKKVNDENAKPKRRYISPSTREEVYALYYDGLRRRIEDRGTRNFPEYRGRKLYGELTMNVTIDALGNVIDTEIVRSSASDVLDRRAIAIVRAAAPFGRFTSAMKNQADQLVITSRFRFTRDDGLEATVTAPP